MKGKISLAGDLGSGKSTVSGLLINALGAEYYSTGSIIRAIADDGINIVLINFQVVFAHPFWCENQKQPVIAKNTATLSVAVTAAITRAFRSTPSDVTGTGLICITITPMQAINLRNSILDSRSPLIL